MKKINLYIFTKYSSLGASSRYRVFQYLKYFNLKYFTPVIFPLFDENYLNFKYKNENVGIYKLIFLFFRRVSEIIFIPCGSIVVIEYELFPFFPSIFERYLNFRRCRIILDYDDAIFHRYDQCRFYLVRALLGGKISNIMRVADMVIVGNSYIEEYAIAAGARDVQLLPTVVDLSRYKQELKSVNASLFTIGWIGSPTTAPFLLSVELVLSQFLKNTDTRVILIGSGAFPFSYLRPQIFSWSENSEVDYLNSLDVGIMPLPDDPWSRGKCGLKLIQYMACGLPVVASPVGVNTEIVQHGVNGFLASTTDEWIKALEMLRADPDLRKRMGAAGRKLVEEKYCLEVTAPKYVKIIEDVARRITERRN